MQQIVHCLLHNGQYTISWIPLAAIFSTHTKLKQKTSTYIPKTFRKWLLWCHFPAFSQSVYHFLFYKGHFKIIWICLTVELLKLHQLKPKTSIDIPRTFRKYYLQTAFWYYFPSAAQPIHHSLFYKGQLTISWLLLAAKLLRSHPIKNKNLYVYLKDVVKTRLELAI